MDVCDFANSYIRWVNRHNPDDRRKPGHMPYGNSVRIQIDARCLIADERTGQSEEYVLITPCRAEWMYRQDTLFQSPNREFCEIWSRSESMSVGHGMTYQGEKNTALALKDRFVDFGLTMRSFPRTRALQDAEQVIQATLDNVPLVARTELWDGGRNVRATIEYPVKTMNINPEYGRFQVDTGPLLFPDFDRAVDRPIERFSVAFVCYNTFDRAEFILRSPTPIRDGNTEVFSVVHYSDIRRVAAKNVVIRAGEE